MSQLNVSRNQLKISQARNTSSKLDGKFYTLDQEHDCLQSIFCCFCEGGNEFAVSETDPNFNVSSKKGYIKESSDCLSRLFCVCNRPFQNKLRLFNQDIAISTRQCKCCLEFMPCLENEIVVTNKSGRVLGILRVGCWCFSSNHFSCADAQIQVLSGENQELLYTVEGNCCQKSLCCPLFRCCYCPIIQYNVFDNLKLKVGKIVNIYNGCMTEMFSRADKFGIEFPAKADQDHKILLLFAVMYLDYIRYETPIVCLGVR